MKQWWKTLPLMLLALALPLRAAERCAIEPLHKSDQPVGPWIDQDNWLAPENLRIGLQSPGSFMSRLKITAPLSPEALTSAPRQLDLEKIGATDPLDQQQRDLGFLLDTRLYADGLLVLRNGKVLSERYWNGLSALQPRLLLDGTRPILSLMGAVAVAQGKLSPDRSIIRYIPALSAQKGLRKLSIQRLLEGSRQFVWSPQEIADWQEASGWKSGKAAAGIRAWLNQPDRWEKEFASEPLGMASIAPDGDLLTWALAESNRQPLASIFCETVLGKLRPESPVFWLTDPKGIELSGGLALSLRDFARFGQMLIEAGTGVNRSKIPNWFIETLTGSRGIRKTNPPELTGLKKGSESRYGFVHLGGEPNRIAILGPYGNSLYIDFDHRLVIALFATYPKKRSAAMLATLEQIWETLGAATQPARKR